MTNPILSKLNQVSPQMAQMTNIVNLKNMISGNPAQMAQTLLNSNPQFRQFYEQNKGKSPQEIASNYGIDYNSLLQILK